jgi:hypothetical protein
MSSALLNRNPTWKRRAVMKRARGASSILLKLGAGALCLYLAALLALARSAQAEATGSTPPSGDAELARELSDPVADLVTIPIQMNYDHDIGARSARGWAARWFDTDYESGSFAYDVNLNGPVTALTIRF